MPAPLARRPLVAGHDVHEAVGWEAASCPADAHAGPSSIDGLDWMAAPVPGTAASALRLAGRWEPGDPRNLDAEDWWFRATLPDARCGAGEESLLVAGGIATVAEAFINGESVLESDSMFAMHRVDVGALLRGGDELAIRCRALSPILAVRRRPSARWRTRIVAQRNLRFIRTSSLGRAPGFAPGPAPVGPWRPVRIERGRGVAMDSLEIRTRLEGTLGAVSVRVRVRGLEGARPTAVRAGVNGPSGTAEIDLALEADGDSVVGVGEIAVPAAEQWWPHTHGTPALHDLRLVVHTGGVETEIGCGRVGFRALTWGDDPGEDGLALSVNGVPIFARGAIWTPVDPVGLAPEREAVRATVERAAAAGMNMLRVVGTGAYESDYFLDLCDELGLMVWQDMMFANHDYPISDPGFRDAVAREARDELARFGGRPGLAVVCGNSEVEQQVAMLGLDPGLGRGELFGEMLAAAVVEAGLEAPYLPSSPCGGALPFRPDRGVAHYFGVGAYRRPLDDARRSRVRFASECLAFANVGDGTTGAGRAEAGVPRDAGVAWDFADVRDHYLRELFGVDADDLRFCDPERYLELSRAVTGEVMARTMGEWRRSGSPCGGALILWLRDIAPGSGWGVLDAEGRPKAAYHHLRRALAPVAVWTTDEGLGGVRVHVANDRPTTVAARLRIALYADGADRPLAEGAVPLKVPPHTTLERDAEAVLGRFADASLAYRFGPGAHDAVVASLEAGGGAEPGLIADAVHFPGLPPLAAQDAGRMGLEAEATPAGSGCWRLRLLSRGLVYGARVRVPGMEPSDDCFHLEPGHERTLTLREGAAQAPPQGTLTALNLRGGVPIGFRE